MRAEIDARPGGVSQLAKDLGRARNTVYNWIEKQNVPVDELLRMADLGIDIQYVISGAAVISRLTTEEAVLIEELRSLPGPQREQVFGWVTALHEKAVRDGAGGVRVRERKPPPESA